MLHQIDRAEGKDTWCFAQLVPFLQFKKREKLPWRSVIFSKVANRSRHFTKSNAPPWIFFTFFKLCKWYQIAQSVIYNPIQHKTNSFRSSVPRYFNTFPYSAAVTTEYWKALI